MPDPAALRNYDKDERKVMATGHESKELPPGVDGHQLEAACLNLAELPEALAFVQVAQRDKGCGRGGRGPSRGQS